MNSVLGEGGVIELSSARILPINRARRRFVWCCESDFHRAIAVRGQGGWCEAQSHATGHFTRACARPAPVAFSVPRFLNPRRAEQSSPRRASPQIAGFGIYGL